MYYFYILKSTYKVKVVCETIEIYEDGKIYLADCKVNDTEVKDYTYGTKQEAQPTRYYSWLSGSIGEDLPSDANQDVSKIDTKGYPFYLGLDVDSDNKVTSAYACFKKSDVEYCLKGYDTEAYETNKTILKKAFGESNCTFSDNNSSCAGDDLVVYAFSFGRVASYDGDTNCYVYSGGGDFGCYEY